MSKRICHLPPELVGEKILSKVPLTSLGAVRSTCKLWDALTREWVLGEEALRQQFMSFMIMDSKVCSFRFHLGKEEDLVDISIKPVALLNQVEMSKVFHCHGLLLCVAKDNSRLVVWNPYLGQTRWIVPRRSFHRGDKYALGCDMNGNHKILRFVDDLVDRKHLFEFEIYDFSSNSWRVLEVRPDWEVEFYQRGMSLKGSTYFVAHEKTGNDFFNPPEIGSGEGLTIDLEEVYDFLLCFDFTTEKFGLRLPLPFHSIYQDTVTFSCVREEQLAVLYQKEENYSLDILEIWVTTKIEPNAVSWSKFLKVDMRPLLTGFLGVWFDYGFGSFFIDEQEKVAVVFDVDGHRHRETPRYHTAFIIGVDGYFKSVSLGEAPNVYDGMTGHLGYIPQIYSPPLVCSSSYLPSLVQLNQPRKRKQRDDFRFASCTTVQDLITASQSSSSSSSNN